jgi:hypothetical protein
MASLTGLAVAWKWELAGAAITLLAVLVGAYINWRSLVPSTIIVATAMTYLASWWMNRTPRHDLVVRTQQ